ncbi:HAMP domain-containing sensor histidine kinase [Ureibacillus sinduriensis]|uniref:Signal transduction histidine-protein kinase ArlS n=1 Tax=Ureibacillus sinduriensis BLB-1 = JCM 15800 TaxID=1384057 RepID=A0A0A3I095_9BACL|nr:HAMP domain-containing histidine kinase [Ureibacillus sinduriensis]KGR76920.1 histidine kinase [Ureibacillus sinduriensis BLB-1 = JCM 15800]
MNKLRELLPKNQSLKKKWTISTAVVIFISYAVICSVIYLAFYSWLIQNEENNAIRTADDLTSFFSSQDNSISIQEFQRNTGLSKAIVNQNQTARIFNFDGYEVLQINNVNSAVALDLSYDQLEKPIVAKVNVDNEDVFVVNKLVTIGNFTGILQLIHPLSTFQSMMQYIITTMLIAGIGAILLAGFIGYYLANVLIRPLQDLRDSMLSIQKKGFEEKINFTYDADDEIGDLLKLYVSMMEDLESSFAKQQQFVSDASHELRTPIQAIEGHLSLLQRWGKNDPDVLEESLNTSLEEVTKMKKMIEELLDLARKEERDEDAAANVKKVLSSVREELLIIYPNASIGIVEKGESKQAKITENALAQIARNIIENGIRYNDSVVPIIEMEVHYLSESIFLTIRDNGIGIPKEHLPYIFDRFYRVDPSRENNGGGTGLGLSITKMLTEKYQTEIDVTSMIGKGTTFTLKMKVS